MEEINKKQKQIFILMIAFGIFNITDGITSFFILHGEINPIFLLTNNIFIVFFMKIILLILLLKIIYNPKIYTNEYLFFLIKIILFYGSIFFIVGTSSNIYGILHPEEINYIQDYTIKERILNYFLIVSIIFIIPLIISMIIFWILSKREIYKKRKVYI